MKNTALKTEKGFQGFFAMGGFSSISKTADSHLHSDNLPSCCPL